MNEEPPVSDIPTLRRERIDPTLDTADNTCQAEVGPTTMRSGCLAYLKGDVEMLKPMRQFCCVVLWLGASAGLFAVDVDQHSGWKAGVARVDTTPAMPVRMAGYASRTRPSEGVAHPLAAKALALADASDHKIVIVTCDIIGFRRSFTNRVDRPSQDTVRSSRATILSLFASHNHAGPALVELTDSTGTPVPVREGFENNVGVHEETRRSRSSRSSARRSRTWSRCNSPTESAGLISP